MCIRDSYSIISTKTNPDNTTREATFDERLDDLISKINANEDSAVEAAKVDGKLQLTTKAEGGKLGEVKITTEATAAQAEIQLNQALVAGGSIKVGDLEYRCV